MRFNFEFVQFLKANILVGANRSDWAIFPIGLAIVFYKETIIKQCLPNLVIPTLSDHLVRSPELQYQTVEII